MIYINELIFMLFIWLCNLDFEINEKKSTSLFIIVDGGKVTAYMISCLFFKKLRWWKYSTGNQLIFWLLLPHVSRFCNHFLFFPFFFSPLYSLSILLSLLLSHVNLTTHERVNCLFCPHLQSFIFFFSPVLSSPYFLLFCPLNS